jgi:hypothetical protein
VILTVFGEVSIKRPRYRCIECKSSLYPDDESLEIGRSMVSKRFAKISTMMMIFAPFEHTRKMLEESLSITVSETCLMMIANRIGTKLYKKAEQKGRMPYSIRKDKTPSDILYIQSDGAMVPIARAETLEYKENKLGLVYTDRDIKRSTSKNGKERIEIRNKRFVSSIGEGVDNFKKMLYATAIEKGLRGTGTVILLSDGASWISKMRDDYFANAIQILDWYHAVDHLWITAHVLFGENNHAKCEEWVVPRKELLWNGCVDEVIKQLEEEAKIRKKNQTAIHELRGYYMSNRNNMRYAEFRDKGYYIGSGAIESANKYIVANRLKLAGMRWTLSHANAMIWLRCKYYEDQWDSFWEKLNIATYLADHGETHPKAA